MSETEQEKEQRKLEKEIKEIEALIYRIDKLEKEIEKAQMLQWALDHIDFKKEEEEEDGRIQKS